MKALDRKVLRDLWHVRGQALAIALVIASGVAVLVMSLSTRNALIRTKDAYYERYAFAHVFARCKRAPGHLISRIAAIDGVQVVQTRVKGLATLDIAGFDEPVLGQFVSIPENGDPALNRLVLRRGRWIRASQPDEVVLDEPFAEAHGFVPGDELVAVLNGNRRTLSVVGIALSPEFVFSMGPGALMPDARRFGVLWMGSEALAAAFDQEGAFNDVSLQLTWGASSAEVIERLDRILEPYGGVGAVARREQGSNWFLMNEIDQLSTMSMILPSIFLIVSAFLTNMVLARLVETERTQIGLMKAFGYGTRTVAAHYTKLVLVIAGLGILLGWAIGTWAGRMNTGTYAQTFRFPILFYRPDAASFAISALMTLSAALLGTWAVVRRAALLAPAQAMVPPSPPLYRKSLLARTRLGQWLDQPTRILVRHIAREPWRALMTAGGVACSVALLVMALQWYDAIDYLVERYFFDSQRQHVTIGLAEPQASSVVADFRHLPGVMAVEPMRIVGADLHFGTVTHRGSVTGVPSNAQLMPIFDEASMAVYEPLEGGLILGSRLAEKLGAEIGDAVWVEILEGRRSEAMLPIVALIETSIALPAYLHIRALDRLLRERPGVEYVNLLVDPHEEANLYRRLKDLPAVSSVLLRRAAIRSFDESVAKNMLIFVSLFCAFSCALGFGVAYNAARVALSERGRELATLRVLGFHRSEVSYILLGEVGLLILLSLPTGCLLGRALTILMASAFDTELFRIPLGIEPSTYGLAVCIAVVATLLSAGIVRRRVDRLPLIEVLKTRE